MANWLNKLMGKDDSDTFDDLLRDMDETLNRDLMNAEKSSEKFANDEQDFAEIENVEVESDDYNEDESDSETEVDKNFGDNLMEEWRQHQMNLISDLDVKKAELQKQIDELKKQRRR